MPCITYRRGDQSSEDSIKSLNETNFTDQHGLIRGPSVADCLLMLVKHCYLLHHSHHSSQVSSRSTLESKLGSLDPLSTGEACGLGFDHQSK